MNLDTLYGHTAHILSLDVLFNKRIISCSIDSTVRVWKIEEQSHLMYNSASLPIDCVTAVNNNSYASGGQDGHLSLWTSGKKKPVFVLEHPHDGDWVTAVASLHGTDLLASGSHNGVVKLYKVTPNSIEEKTQVAIRGYVNSLKFTTDGKLLVAAVSSDYRLGRWTPSIKQKPGIHIIKLTIDSYTV